MMTVSSLNTKIKSLLEATFMHIMVEGEIASVTYHNSGHIYFSIKDDSSTIRCVMWRSSAARLKFRLVRGEHIVIEGSIGVYTPRGEYQFMATHIEPYGKGALAVAFEQLKTKLKAKGYFDTSCKKVLPKYPQTLAFVTASNSAALQDMLKVATKRWPGVGIKIIDVLVQGETAHEEIARGITYADTLQVDIIIVGRGGGSSEDLWAFNEEIVADAIYAASTPVVSAVGHEVDTLISDFVADLRAPTPSAAIEMILPDCNEIQWMLEERVGQYAQRVRHIMDNKAESVRTLQAELSRSSLPYRLSMMQQQFDTVYSDMSAALTYRLMQYRQQTVPLEEKLQQSIWFLLRRREETLHGYATQLASLDPKQQMRDAWVQVNQQGKKVLLEEIAVGEEFDLLSGKSKMRVKSIGKELLGAG